MNTRVISSLSIACAYALFTNFSVAGDLSVNTGIDAEWVEQQIDVVEGNRDIGSSNQIIKPFAVIDYIARDVRASFRGTHNHVRRQLDGENFVQNFPTLNVSGDYDAVPGLINFSASGSQSYRSSSLNSFLVDDFLLNGENLNKVNTYRGAATLTLPRGKYFALNTSAFFNKIDSDQNENNTSSINSLFNSESYGASLSALSGKRIRGIRSSLTGNLNYVERSEAQNFVSQSINFNNDIKVYKQLGIALNAAYENNELKRANDDAFQGLRKFSSVGAGLIWQSSNDRSLEIAWNRSFKEAPGGNGETDEDSFISYDVNWAFSSRTQLQGTFSRRFYGDAGNVSFIHQLRNWRSSITYNERVNTTSQLASNSDVALFICQGAGNGLASCQLANSLNPVLEAGQILTPLVVQNFELNDRVILNKNLTAQTAVTRRKTTLSLTGTRSQIEELEIDRNLETSSVKLQVAFAISAKTNLTVASSYNTIESIDTATPEEQTTTEQSIQLTRKISKRFSASVGLRYLDRKGDLERQNDSLRGLNGSLTDTRLTFKVRYNFGNIQ